MADKRKMSERKIKVVAIVLFSLTLLCALVFIGRYLYLKYSFVNGSTAVVSENLIGKAPESTSENSVNTLSNSAEEKEAESEKETENFSEKVTEKVSSKPSEKVTEKAAESFSVNPTEKATVKATEKPTEKATDSDKTDIENSTIDSGIKNNSPTLELYKKHPSDNEEFEVFNMLPGDTVTKYFCVKISHDGDVTLRFNAEVTEQTKNLADVLYIKITHLDRGTVLYNGTFADMDINGYAELFKASSQTQSTAYYQITVNLPTSVKNEHQAAMLKADFNWYVSDGQQSLTTPKTGDNSNILLYVVLCACSLAFILVLIFFRRRSKEEDNQNEA